MNRDSTALTVPNSSSFADEAYEAVQRLKAITAVPRPSRALLHVLGSVAPQQNLPPFYNCTSSLLLA